MKKKGTETFKREDWLQAALKSLMKEGIDNVRVERLAKNLGVTKGSFYWHFKDRKELLSRILQYWADEMNVSVFEQVTNLDANLETKLYTLLEEIILKGRGKLDPAIRIWAKSDRSVANVVKDIDRQRLAFLTQLLLDMGFDAMAADTRAQLLYVYMVSESTVLYHLNKEQLTKEQRFKNLQRTLDVIIDKTRQRHDSR